MGLQEFGKLYITTQLVMIHIIPARRLRKLYTPLIPHNITMRTLLSTSSHPYPLVSPQRFSKLPKLARVRPLEMSIIIIMI